MRQYGLIGKEISYSFSPSFFAEKFKQEDIGDAVYSLFPLDTIDDFPSILQPQIKGLNVTIPYKTAIIPYLDELDEVSKNIGAVNTIAFINHKKKGFNTDAPAFQQTVEELLLQKKIKTALVFGTGGAAGAVCYALDQLHIDHLSVSRNPKDKKNISYEQLRQNCNLSDYDLLVNCTPLGSVNFPEEYPPIDYDSLKKEQVLYDLIYSPAKTVFLAFGKAKGCHTVNGHQMLIKQANMAWEIWQKH